MVKVKLIYPHSIGDRIELYGHWWSRDGESHYSVMESDQAKIIVNNGQGEIIGEIE